MSEGSGEETHYANSWCDIEPTVLDKGPRPVANHILKVAIEALSTLDRRQIEMQGQQHLMADHQVDLLRF